jgi:AmiR/NasT family two-component response regulator
MGHQVLSPAADAAQAESVFRSLNPDLVLTDIRLGNDDGLELAQRLLKIRACPILVISAFSDRELIERAKAVGVFGYLVKPVSSPALAAQIEVAVARFREHMVLLAQKESLAANLENRKLIERAKGLLMKHQNLSEPEAHKALQQASQSRRISAVELAKRVIDSDGMYEL